MPALRAADIVKDYQEGRESFRVLKGVGLEVEPGEVVALEGPSGSGKTTLLQIIGCILSPTGGELEIQGRRVEGSRPAELAELRRKHIGFVFQQYNLFPSLTVLENVQYALQVKGWKGEAAKKEASSWIDAVGLGDRARFHPVDLSGGQKQRVAIARAMAGNPAVLLADEPTANLDTQVGTQVLELFRELATRHGRAVLVVTHDPKVRAVSDRVLRICDGLIES